MKEQSISLETAKLAKKMGFSWYSEYMYDDEGRLCRCKIGMHGNPNNYAGYYSAPTKSLFQGWLRDVKGVVVEVELASNQDGLYYYFKQKRILKNPNSDAFILHVDTRMYNTYTEALSEGLIYTLNQYNYGRK